MSAGADEYIGEGNMDAWEEQAWNEIDEVGCNAKGQPSTLRDNSNHNGNIISSSNNTNN